MIHRQFRNSYPVLVFLVIPALLLGACQPQVASFSSGVSAEEAVQQPAEATPELPVSTPLPTRPVYSPGELVDYIAQTGDTLPVLALRFNTSVEEIRQANTFIPQSATTMPPGMPMKIPIYFLALWASPFQILPDHAFVDGPTVIGFNTSGQIIQIDPQTGAGTLLATRNVQFWGAGMSPDVPVNPCP